MDCGKASLGFTPAADENGREYDSGQVISKVYYENLQKPEFQNDFQVLDSSYARLTERGALYNKLSRLQRQLTPVDKKIEAWSKVSLAGISICRADASRRDVCER